MRQTKFASSLVNFRVYYKIIGLYFNFNMGPNVLTRSNRTHIIPTFQIDITHMLNDQTCADLLNMLTSEFEFGPI